MHKQREIYKIKHDLTVSGKINIWHMWHVCKACIPIEYCIDVKTFQK